MAQKVKNLPAVWETWVRFLGWEDPLENELATDSSILAWRIPWTEDPGEPWGLQRVGHNSLERIEELETELMPKRNLSD